VKLPKSDAKVVERFADLVPHDPRVTTRKMFGNPAAFVNGNLFFGVFGAKIFVRLSATDVERAGREGFGSFEPMPGRAMTGYAVIPDAVLREPSRVDAWVGRSLKFAASLPAKKTKTARP